jgi:hypothetical protein
MKVESVKIQSLKSDPENARKHSQRNIEAIANSLKRFGQRRPLVVWNNIVIAGNGTLEAALSIGWTEISIARCPAEWDHEHARAYALTDNRTSELGIWDHQILADQLVELDSNGWDVAEFGFVPLSPPDGSMDPYKEWDAMPEFDQPGKPSAFKTSIHFPTERDANDFFELINRPKKASFWYPEDDGHVGSSVTKRYVADE